jgi:hypothetical protein
LASLSDLKQILSLLVKVKGGQIDAHTALSQWPGADSETDADVKRAWHHLYHFASDYEIQVQDPRYRDYQLELFQRDLDALQKKCSVDAAMGTNSIGEDG